MAGLGNRLGRWLRHSGTGQFLGAHLGALYIRTVLATTRWRVIGQDNYDQALAHDGGVVAAIWHGRLAMMPYWVPRTRRLVAMISNNRDGDLISAALGRFGIAAVRGSTYDHAKRRDKGGGAAFAAGVRELTQQKAIVALTPDGPRGPCMRAQPGVAMLALQTGAPVYPVAYSTVRGKHLRSWDRFLLPFPFGRGVQIVGPRIDPPEGTGPEDHDAFLQRIEVALTGVTNEADRLCGREPVTPGPPVSRP